ncbi:MAG TPA: tetratricopeptide repeat protein [Nitrososphaeraceae archaeon]|jgi:tetratricopeptide (TPR) repeat protein|nr:tetratricopeptide repeat protein [Nitrososphaeraceae archaeon]
MSRFLGRKKADSSSDAPPYDTQQKTGYNDNLEFQKRDLYKKGVNQMANEKLEEAIRSFELALRIDPKYVDAWIKRGYAHFHLGDYTVSISSYDKALEIDLSNAEAWNLKGLAYYKMKNYDKAIEACEKAIDINPNDGMSWYNKACYLTLTGKVEEGMEALKRSIEIDISYAKKAVRDIDFENAKAEEGFRRIIEVVVLESIRQGYDYVGKILWITGIDRQDIEDAIMRLSMKGLIIRKEKKTFTGKEEYYELAKEIADKIGVTKRTGFLGGSKEISAPIQQLKDISEILGRAKDSVEKGDVNNTLENFEQLINPAKHGNAMIEQFFDEHRDLRLFQIRLKDKGQEYLNSHKSDLIKVLSDIDAKIRNSPVTKPAKD